MYKIENNLLVLDDKPVPQYPSPNIGGTLKPSFLVIHYTASAHDAHGIGKFFQNPANKVSAHLNLSENGEFTQSVPFNRVAWHAGKSQWQGISGLNSHSIGIEVCNPGPLTRLENGKFKSWWGKIYDSNDYPIFEATHPFGSPKGWWIPFTEEQNEALLTVGALLMDEFRLKEAVGHDMISPGRKSDPGPCMDSRIYSRLNGDRAADTGFGDLIVTSNRLNVRSKPETTASVITVVTRGTVLDFISQSGSWFYIEMTDGRKGYVHSNFVVKKT